MPVKKAIKKESIGKKIKRVRADKNVPLERVANETGFSVDYLREIESGQAIPPVGAILQIARALEIDSASLLKEQGSSLEKRIKTHTKRTENYAYKTLTPAPKTSTSRPSRW